MDDRTFNALHHSQVIDLTTTGRRSGQPRRIEIFLHEKDGLLFITGVPRPTGPVTGSTTLRLTRRSLCT